MKLVVSGKGGVGKTTFAGTMAMILAEEGRKVLAVDSDPSMNLHSALGLENPQPISGLKDLIRERTVMEGGVFRLNPRVDDIPDRFSTGRDGLRLIVMGTVERGGEGCICPETAFLKALLRHLALKKDEVLILDTEAGVEHLGRNVAERFDRMLVVCEPSEKAVETANRINTLSQEIGIREVLGVANKISTPAQEEFVRSSLDFELAGTIPFDEAVIEADMTKKPLFTYHGSAALKSIREILHRIMA
ncbi:MAG: carbon monoxide dehydrogenase [Methanobacteriota archaeon]|nr:MAG: carbon monoxide dehydrogenase [Euryarchaeota archaeon]